MTSLREITLFSGLKMPSVGLGTFQGAYSYEANTEVTRAAVVTAIKAGYRMIDTAKLYQTEEGVGLGIKDAVAHGFVRREDLYITTKLWSQNHRTDDVEKELDESLKLLGLAYVDLYLIHWPTALKKSKELIPKDEKGNVLFDDDIDYLETWAGMEKCHVAGKARSIGLSNFNAKQLARIIEQCAIKPAAIQMEIHPYHLNSEVVEFAREHHIAVVAYAPFAKGSSRPGFKEVDPCVFTDPIIKKIAEHHEKTTAQVTLGYLLQSGFAVVPKSSSPERIVHNIEVFEFALDDNEMKEMKSLDQGLQIVRIDWLKPSKYYPYKEDSI